MTIFRLPLLTSAIPLPLFSPPGDEEPGEVKDLPADKDADAAAAALADKGGDKGGDKSFLSDDASLKDKPGAPAGMPDNWRDLVAGEDKEARKLLDRVKSPADLGKNYRETLAKVRSGKTEVAARPADDKPEDLKAWREAQGIPADPTGYKLDEPVVKLFTDQDKPAIEMFTAGMHKLDMPSAAVNATLQVYADMQEQMRAADKVRSIETQDELRQEWGPDFKTNVKAARVFGETSIPGVNWLEARLPDGRRMGDIPDVVKGLVDLSRLKFGETAFVGEAATKVTEGRMAEIKALQADTKSEYYTDGGKLRGELMGLENAKAKNRARVGDSEQ